jgi:hypothetical protein
VRTGINLFRYSIGNNYCAIKGCSNTAGQIGRFGKAVKLHLLSKSKVIRADWLHAISKENFNLNLQDVLNCATIIFRVELIIYRSACLTENHAKSPKKCNKANFSKKKKDIHFPNI